MISFENVTFSYPNADRPALRNVSLTVEAGELTLLVGPSGSGKSTLLRLINGLVPHFSGGDLAGNVRVDGLDPVAESPQQMSQHVGFVFQDPEAQFVVDRVEDEIAFALEHLGMAPAEMRLRVEEVLDLLDLASLRDRPLETLSGGERQRVAIASALVLRPSVLVLDEPTSQLDPQSAEDVLNALVRLNTDLGLTIVLAEHRLERVLPFADWLVYLPKPTESAEVSIIDGPPRDVLAQFDLGSPLAQLGKALGWQPLPLTIKEAMRFSRSLRMGNRMDISDEQVRANVSPQPTPPANKNQPLLEAKRLDFGYAQAQVLNNVDFVINPGEMIALMGRNGSGKSTLLRCLMGLLQPQRGRVELKGQSIVGPAVKSDVAEIATTIGYLPQDPNALLFAESVYEELATTLRNHGHEPERAQIEELLAFLGIEQLAERYPRDLSVGERQRVALAAVAIMQPEILLLDEPTRGLDHAAKDSLLGLLQKWQQKGMAVVVVTHDVEFAAKLADRVVLLSQGEVLLDGSPYDVLGASPFFTTQVARLFPNRGWLTLDDVVLLPPPQPQCD